MYNIFCRKGEEQLFALLKKEKISFYAYSPLAGGLFNYSSQQEATSANSRYIENSIQVLKKRYAPGNAISKLYGNKFFKDSFMNVNNAI